LAEGAGGERRDREAECAGIGEDCGAGEGEHVWVELRRTATEVIIRPRRGRGRGSSGGGVFSAGALLGNLEVEAFDAGTGWWFLAQGFPVGAIDFLGASEDAGEGLVAEMRGERGVGGEADEGVPRGVDRRAKWESVGLRRTAASGPRPLARVMLVVGLFSFELTRSSAISSVAWVRSRIKVTAGIGPRATGRSIAHASASGRRSAR